MFIQIEKLKTKVPNFLRYKNVFMLPFILCLPSLLPPLLPPAPLRFMKRKEKEPMLHASYLCHIHTLDLLFPVGAFDF